VTQARLRPLAEADLIDKTAHYRSAGGKKLAERFFDSALASLRSIERMPGIGCPLVGEMCDIAGLRSCPVKGFLIHWYYFIAENHLDVVRLLADAQDLPTILSPTDAP
jgi:plasmid stabilization system protein ParE